MVKATLQFENAAFEAEGDFGVALAITKNDKEGVAVKGVSTGSGNIADISYALGQAMGKILKKLAVESGSDVRAMFVEFANGMFDD